MEKERKRERETKMYAAELDVGAGKKQPSCLYRRNDNNQRAQQVTRLLFFFFLPPGQKLQAGRVEEEKRGRPRPLFRSGRWALLSLSVSLFFPLFLFYISLVIILCLIALLYR